MYIGAAGRLIEIILLGLFAAALAGCAPIGCCYGTSTASKADSSSLEEPKLEAEHKAPWYSSLSGGYEQFSTDSAMGSIKGPTIDYRIGVDIRQNIGLETNIEYVTLPEALFVQEESGTTEFFPSFGILSVHIGPTLLAESTRLRTSLCVNAGVGLAQVYADGNKKTEGTSVYAGVELRYALQSSAAKVERYRTWLAVALRTRGYTWTDESIQLRSSAGTLVPLSRLHQSWQFRFYLGWGV